MRLMTIVLVLYQIILLPSTAVAITTYSSSPVQQIISSAIVADHDSAPLFFSVRAGELSPPVVRATASGDSIYYQSTGSAKVIVEQETTVLQSGTGIFLPAGTSFTMETDGGHQPAAYLQFLLAPRSRLERAQPLGISAEIYRSPLPIPDLTPKRNLLSLTRVAVPPESPCDPLHQRSGAALHYVLAGVGAEFTINRAVARAPGAVSFEPNGTVYQWSNPGSARLVYLVFNVNPQNIASVIEVDDPPQDPFSVNSHITWAIYCVALSMAFALLLCAALTAEYYQQSNKRRPKR